MLPEAVLAFVTNEQSTAARQAKPSLRNHSTHTASQSGRPESSRGSSRPFQLSRISALSRYRRRAIIFLKFVFICGVSLRRHCCAESRCVTEKRALCHRAIRPRRLCVKPSAQSLEKVTDVFFFPGEQGLFFLLFPNARRVQALIVDNWKQRENTQKYALIPMTNKSWPGQTDCCCLSVVGFEKTTANQLSESGEQLQRFASGHRKKQLPKVPTAAGVRVNFLFYQILHVS